MAFIGGVAVAGLAALLLLKGSGNSVQPNFNVPQVQAPAVVAPPMMNQPGAYPGLPTYPNQQLPPSSDTNELRTQLERQKTQLDVLQRENDQLKNQNQQLHSQMQTFYQSQLNAQQNQSVQQAALQQTQEPWWSSGILWAVGGMALTVGGGIVVAGVSALFTQKQRPTRTVQVIHPYNGSGGQTISPPVRRAEFLPPRSERRVEAHEYDDTY